jgi:hypothetical protein
VAFGSWPQGLKPRIFRTLVGRAEALPYRSFIDAIRSMEFDQYVPWKRCSQKNLKMQKVKYLIPKNLSAISA